MSESNGADIIDITKLSRKKKRDLKIGIIIQARMTSKRFPGKSMALLLGKPVIQHVIDRAKQIRPASKVILAVPDTDASEPLLELAARSNIDNFCGDEYNVLDRYYKAAEFFNLDVIVRITGDCPFINPIVCSEVLQLLLWRRVDYSSNVYPKRTYPKGFDCEAFTMDALHLAWIVAETLEEKEHVTPVLQNVDEITKANVVQQTDKSFINYCVDIPSDISRLAKLATGKKASLLLANKSDTKKLIIEAASNDKN